jgi:hypothetical protein
VARDAAELAAALDAMGAGAGAEPRMG